MPLPCEPANHWQAIVAVCWLLHACLEAWLGKSEKVKSGSVLELIFRFLRWYFLPKAPTLLATTETILGEKNMPVNTVPVQLNVPKESKEVVDALKALVAEIKAKKPIGEIVASALPKVITAVDGFDQVDDEIKSENKSDLIAYLSKEISSALGL